MGLKNISTAGIVIIIILASILATGVIYAVTTWNKDYTWTVDRQEITVYNDSGEEIDNTPLYLGQYANGSTIQLTYYVKNTGNINATVSGSVSPLLNATTPVWETNGIADTHIIELEPNDTAIMIVTFTITGDGSATVKFDILGP